MRHVISSILLLIMCLVFSSCPGTPKGANHLKNGDIEVYCGIDYKSDPASWDDVTVSIVLGDNYYINSIDKYATAESLGISIKNDDFDLSPLFLAKKSIPAKSTGLEFFYSGFSTLNDDNDVPLAGEVEVSISAEMLELNLELQEDMTPTQALVVGKFDFKRSARVSFDEEFLTNCLAFKSYSEVSFDNAEVIDVSIYGAKFNEVSDRQEVNWFSNLPDGLKVYQLQTSANSTQSTIKITGKADATANAVRLECVIPPESTTSDASIKSTEKIPLFVVAKENDQSRKVYISDCPITTAPGWYVKHEGIVIRIEGDCVYRDINAKDYAGNPVDFTGIFKANLPDGVKIYLQDDIKAGDNKFTVYAEGTPSVPEGSTSKVNLGLRLTGNPEDELRLLTQNYTIESKNVISTESFNTINSNAYIEVKRIAFLSDEVISPQPDSEFSVDVAVVISDLTNFSNKVQDYKARLNVGKNVTSWIKNDLKDVMKNYNVSIKEVKMINNESNPEITFTISGKVLNLQENFVEPLAIAIPSSHLPYNSGKSGEVLVVKSDACRFQIIADV